MVRIKARQVAGVTSLVGVVVLALSALQLVSLARVSLEETVSRGEMLSNAIFQNASRVVPAAADPYTALREDPGVRSILESAVAYSRNVTYAAIVDTRGVAVAHGFPALEGQPMARHEALEGLEQWGAFAQLRAIYSGRIFEVRQPLLIGSREFGSIRIGVSMLLIQDSLRQAIVSAVQTALVALVVAMLVSMMLGQWMLRPIHVIRSGLTRLGQGEFDVRLDLPPGDEFRSLGSSFEAVSAKLSAVQTERGTPQADPASLVEAFEDAVAMFDAHGALLFANGAMRAELAEATPGRGVDACFPKGHPWRALIETTLQARQSQGPLSMESDAWADARTRRVATHVIEDRDGRFVGAMLVARSVGYLGEVETTRSYSRKLVALGRLLGGVAHEVKNPLNAMTIHLELLKHKLATATAVPTAASPAPARILTDAGHETPTPAPDLLKHVSTIEQEIKRLDEVMTGLLRFARPEELRLQPVQLRDVITEVVRVIEPEARKTGVTVRADAGGDLPDVNADPTMLQQALLNLALNACQAMPEGGALRLGCRVAPGRRVEVSIEDTGTGIPPDHLPKIFDLYFTTKERGSGIGLSMVYRIAQLHDGEVAVESTPGRGTTFKVYLPQT